MDISARLEQEFSLKKSQVQNTLKLIDEGNTIPFIARYRKELTGSLDDQVLRELYERLLYLRNLEARREQVRAAIAEQEKLTADISLALDKAETLAEIEDIYRPFKQKRRTRATIARERGLEPLAMEIWAQECLRPLAELAAGYVDAEKDVPMAEDALAGAGDIIAELISDDADCRGVIRRILWAEGFVASEAAGDAESVYENYYDFSEPAGKIAGHRVLAINRGEKEDMLKVKIEAPDEKILNTLGRRLIKDNRHTREFMTAVLDDSYKRLIEPSMEREVRAGLTEQAEEGAMKVFAENLRQLLLQAPVRDRAVLALDPGFRTGCKVAVIDETGNVLDTDVIYPTQPHNKVAEAKAKLKPMIARHKVDIIAIGNGTASRETEMFAAELIKELDRDVKYVIVNEAGASVYSASKLGAEEFPEYDVALRSAVSIGRRLQDPLAELVKIDPKSIGVGQYQHDLNQKRLGETLGGVVEGCVNSVGVDLNTASPALMSYVAGIGGTVAKNILEYRQSNGKFRNRRELLKVKKLGPKAYEQCAGFLRIPGGKHPLDNTGVHPESYPAAERLLESLGYTLEQVRGGVGDLKRKAGKLSDRASALGVGEPTLADIIKELEKPGRDPREDMPAQILRSDVLSMEDLTPGMELQGTVRNVIDFGAFVDIGVHQDGLVHISQLADRYIKHPLEAVSVGDIVRVRVLAVDAGKKRISLSMKGLN